MANVGKSKSDISSIKSEKSTFGFTEKSRMSDFVINVDGTKLYVSKNILSLASPVFDRMFESEFKESENNEMTLPGKKLEDVVEFLRCIYPNFLHQVSIENAFRLLPLFDEYQVFHLKERCELVLCENINKKNSAVELYEWLAVARKHNLSKLRRTCISLLVLKSYHDLIRAEEECKPKTEDKVEIFQEMCAKLTDKVTSLTDRVTSLENENGSLSKRLNLFQGFNSGRRY